MEKRNNNYMIVNLLEREELDNYKKKLEII